MRRDDSSGDEEEVLDGVSAVNSGVAPMDTSINNNRPKHTRVPPPVKLNGVRSNATSSQPNGRQARPASANRNPGAPVRYFILKSHNRENVERSIDQGVWSTQVSFAPCIYIMADKLWSL